MSANLCSRAIVCVVLVVQWKLSSSQLLNMTSVNSTEFPSKAPRSLQENITSILDELIDGYDNRIRPGIGGSETCWYKEDVPISTLEKPLTRRSLHYNYSNGNIVALMVSDKDN
uniref:Neurotransmitter-gated ion-channel ligand-binding domain-containing protein n=1 Tax=Branchiostoma floridae TaxID=7739 RepID=C3YS79_BRAFL|eukprot:XP_002600972.1 hypothetical protein BRAFLDRAFT_79170 [Branchiostoma floridae]